MPYIEKNSSRSFSFGIGPGFFVSRQPIMCMFLFLFPTQLAEAPERLVYLVSPSVNYRMYLTLLRSIKKRGEIGLNAYGTYEANLEASSMPSSFSSHLVSIFFSFLLTPYWQLACIQLYSNMYVYIWR